MELLYLIDGGLVRPKPVPPVDQHDRLGNALQVYGPIKSGITAPNEQDPLSLELLGVEHLEEETLLLEPLLALNAELSCLNGPDTGRNDDGAGGVIAIRSLQHEVAA